MTMVVAAISVSIDFTTGNNKYYQDDHVKKKILNIFFHACCQIEIIFINAGEQENYAYVMMMKIFVHIIM